jgi:hypothetical protein
VTEAIIHGLEVVEIQEQDRDHGSRSGAARQRVLDAVAEEGPVGQTREPVVERLVADLLVEPGVVERDRGRLRERAAKAEPGLLRGRRLAPVELDGADGLATRHQRQHGHRFHADRAKELDLGRVGAALVDADVHVDVLGEHASRRRVVGELIDVVDRGPPLHRVVAIREDAIAGAVPVADAALVRAGRAREVGGRHVPDLARIHRFEHGR